MLERCFSDREEQKKELSGTPPKKTIHNHEDHSVALDIGRSVTKSTVIWDHSLFGIRRDIHSLAGSWRELF